MLGVLNALFGSLDFSRLVLDLARIVVDVFLAKLDFEGLELHFLGEKVELTVITHVVELLLIGSDFALRISDFLALLHEFVVEGGDFGLVVFDTGVQAGQIVFKILHFEGQLTTDGFDAVDFGKNCLKLVERFQAALNRECFGFGVFGSHYLNKN